MAIELPSIPALSTSVLGSPITQLAVRHCCHEGTIAPFTKKGLSGLLLTGMSSAPEVLVVPPRTKALPDGHQRIIEAETSDAPGALKAGTWRRHPDFLQSPGLEDYRRIHLEVLDSWLDAFGYVGEDLSKALIGLRRPQIGAVHAVHAHWATSDAIATVVMPTGTGKTDTMLAVLVSARCRKVLVVVPSDVLRSQLAERFITLGVLKEKGCRILSLSAKHPVVCALAHIPKTVAEVDAVFERAQVVVTTMNVASGCAATVQERIAFHCSHLFLDEAHHSEAKTWRAFRDRFQAKRVLQFTATPYREDDRLIEGDIIFRYPLRRAQEEGYFKPITFKPIREYNARKGDAVLAEKAVEQLKADFDKGHILMARVDDTARAKEVYALYQKYSELTPVELHTGLTSKELETNRRRVRQREARIIVCVNMLGEGFDLPELKIAAFHDVRKSLAITLQLAGRFTRTRSDLGDATVFANIANLNVRQELKRLYDRDPDWNVLLPKIADGAVDEQRSLRDFLKGFTKFADEIPLDTVRPATSMVAYRTKCAQWTPDNFRAGIPNLAACERVEHTVNHDQKTLVVVTARRVPLRWTDVEALFDWEWDLYVVAWAEDQGLLYINGSSLSGEYRSLAHAVAGSDAVLLGGQDVFRAFAGINRLRLQNVGLSEQLGRSIRYTGRMGADVEPGISEGQRGKATKSVIAGAGFEGGALVGVGASKKGRIWAHQRGSVDKLVEWCRHVGAKLIDQAIDPDEVMKGTLVPELVTERPPSMPIALEWPEDVYMSDESGWSVTIDDKTYSLAAVDLDVSGPSLAGPLRGALIVDDARVEFELELFEKDEIKDYAFTLVSDRTARIDGPGQAQSLIGFFNERPPVFRFADGSWLEGNRHIELKMSGPPFDPAKIAAWDWGSIDITRESQGLEKDPKSIQADVIRRLQAEGGFDVIFDDDSSGEAADIVTVKLRGSFDAPKALEVRLYHCKFSLAPTPGARIKDLYEVCGQAQKSVHWMRSRDRQSDLLAHLLRRNADRVDLTGSTRFELGDSETLEALKEVSHLCPLELKIVIVQPGLSRSKVSGDQLQLLSVTANHLWEMYLVPFEAVGSP